MYTIFTGANYINKVIILFSPDESYLLQRGVYVIVSTFSIFFIVAVIYLIKLAWIYSMYQIGGLSLFF